MDKISTKNSLIKYLYNECDLFEMLEIEHALSEDKELRKTYRALLNARKTLNSHCIQPSQRTLDVILNYAKNEMAEPSLF